MLERHARLHFFLDSDIVPFLKCIRYGKTKEYNAGIKRAKSYAAEMDREEEPSC